MARGLRLKGEIAMSRLAWDDARVPLERALSIARSIGNPTQIWKTHVAVGQLHVDTKRPAEAQQAYGAAAEVIAAGLQRHLPGNRKNVGIGATHDSGTIEVDLG